MSLFEHMLIFKQNPIMVKIYGQGAEGGMPGGAGGAGAAPGGQGGDDGPTVEEVD